MKKRLVAALLAFIILFLVSCDTSIKNDSDDGVIIVDDLGREVRVESFSRVAALTGSLGDIWMLAGGSLSAVAEDAWSELSLELDDNTINLGSSHAISKDTLISLSPDLVIASSRLSNQLELREALESCKIDVVYFDIPDVEGYVRVLRELTSITGRADRFSEYGDAVLGDVKAIIERNSEREAQSVLVLRASSSSIKVKNSQGTMLGGMLEDLGCINIADNDSNLLEALSIERIILSNPDRIFVLQMGDDIETVKQETYRMFEENPLWYELDAVKEGRVHFMEKRLYNIKPNARFAKAYEGLEKILNE